MKKKEEEAVSKTAAAPVVAAPAPDTQPAFESPKQPGILNDDAKQRMLANLRKAYEVPKIGDTEAGTPVPELKSEAAKVEAKRQDAQPDPDRKQEPELSDDIGEGGIVNTEIIVNDDTMDSLITTAFIYVSQGAMKEAMRIYNKLALKYPEHPEVKKLLEEIKNKP